MSTRIIYQTAQTAFAQEAEIFADVYGKGEPALTAIRKKAMEAFAASGIPTMKHEEWKYLNLSSIANTGFRNVSPADKQILSKKEAEQYRLGGKTSVLCIIENGKLNVAASSMDALPKGIHIGSIDDFKNDASVLSHLFHHASFEEESLVALNTMLCYTPVIIKVDASVKSNVLIELAFVSVLGADPLLIPARVLLVAEENSKCSVLESFYTHGAGVPSFTNFVSEVVIGKSASVNYDKVQVEADDAQHINYHKVNMARESHQHLTTITLGGGIVRNNLNIRLDDQQVKAYLNGLYVLNNHQVVDNHTLVDHAMPNCYSSELYKGILGDHSQGVFNGKIFVRQDAQKTNAYQSNKNLLLSSNASMNTKPQLEIFADDVKCSHGATTGQLDEEALFYLRARGIGENVARSMLNHAFAADVINQIENETLRESLMALLDVKLASLQMEEGK